MAARYSADSREDVDFTDEGEFAEVIRLIKKIYDILNRETFRVHKEKEAFNDVAKKLEHVHFAETLKLNIGGQLFTTSLATVRKDPGSILHGMFSGRFDSKPAEDGSYFIDREGTHFRYILNYLRTGQLIVPEDKIIRRELFTEAKFYQVQGMIEELKPCSFEDSCILSVEQRQTLTSWLKDTMAGACYYTLIYRASRDGWAASVFHSFCDRKGPTVVIVKSGYNIFGGYTAQHWESLSSGGFRRDPNSFLFSLVNPSGPRPTKIPLIPGKEDTAIVCNISYGPIFGSGNDLLISNTPNQTNTCTVKLNNTYQLPPGQNSNTFLTGNMNFTVTEMEVFKFEK